MANSIKDAISNKSKSTKDKKNQIKETFNIFELLVKLQDFCKQDNFAHIRKIKKRNLCKDHRDVMLYHHIEFDFSRIILIYT